MAGICSEEDLQIVPAIPAQLMTYQVSKATKFVRTVTIYHGIALLQ